jgi:hypothetical protein
MRERWGFWLKRLPTADSESLPTVLVAAMPRYITNLQNVFRLQRFFHGVYAATAVS